MMLLVCGKIDSCRREKKQFYLFQFIRSVEFAYVFAWFTADSGHSFVRYSFQEIHLVNCDFSVLVSDGRQRSTFRFQMV